MMKKEKTWQCIRSEQGDDLKMFRVRFDYMRNPRNGLSEKMTILESNDSVNVVALTPEQEILFVRQYRFGTGTYTLELPGGLVDDGETHETAGPRELREETGYTSANWAYLGKVASNPVFMSSYVHHWFAKDIQKTHVQQQDEGEDIYFLAEPVDLVKKKLLNGAYTHPHTVNALLSFFAFNGTFVI